MKGPHLQKKEQIWSTWGSDRRGRSSASWRTEGRAGWSGSGATNPPFDPTKKTARTTPPNPPPPRIRPATPPPLSHPTTSGTRGVGSKAETEARDKAPPPPGESENWVLSSRPSSGDDDGRCWRCWWWWRRHLRGIASERRKMANPK